MYSDFHCFVNRLFHFCARSEPEPLDSICILLNNSFYYNCCFMSWQHSPLIGRTVRKWGSAAGFWWHRDHATHNLKVVGIGTIGTEIIEIWWGWDAKSQNEVVLNWFNWLSLCRLGGLKLNRVHYLEGVSLGHLASVTCTRDNHYRTVNNGWKLGTCHMRSHLATGRGQTTDKTLLQLLWHVAAQLCGCPPWQSVYLICSRASARFRSVQVNIFF